MQLSKQMTRILKHCVLRNSKDNQGRWRLDLVRAQGGSLAATDGKVCVLLPCAAPALADGLYRIEDYSLVYSCPIMETFGPETTTPGEQWNYPQSLDFVTPGTPSRAWPMKRSAGNSWRVVLLDLLIQERVYVDVFRFGAVLKACEDTLPESRRDAAGWNAFGLLTTYGPERPVKVEFEYDQRRQDATHWQRKHDRVRVELWMSSFKHAYDVAAL